MLDENTIKQIVSFIFIVILFIFAFIIIKPLFLSILFGLILAYTFNPFNKWLIPKVKNKTLATSITCIVVLAITITIIWFLIPVLTRQVFDAYVVVQSWDVIGGIKKLLPFLFVSDKTTALFTGAYNTFISTAVKVTTEKFTNIIVELPLVLLKLVIVFVVFFYGLRDGNKIIDIMRDSMPFSKNITNRFIEKSRQVTYSVVYGRVVIGIITGLLAGIGFYVVGIKNFLLLSIITMIASIIPLIGPWAVWVPVVIGLLISEKTFR